MYRDIIMQALEDRRVLDLSYAGGAPFAVQPHAILRKPDGTEVLEGISSERVRERYGRARLEDAGCIRESSSASLRAKHFEPRRDFRPVSGGSGLVTATVLGDVAAGM